MHGLVSSYGSKTGFDALTVNDCAGFLCSILHSTSPSGCHEEAFPSH